MSVDHRPPFVVDYFVGNRRFSFLLHAPDSWAEAEAHLAAIRATAFVEGSDVIEIKTNVVTLWIDGLAVWLKARWLNWRERQRRDRQRQAGR